MKPLHACFQASEEVAPVLPFPGSGGCTGQPTCWASCAPIGHWSFRPRPPDGADLLRGSCRKGLAEQLWHQSSPFYTRNFLTHRWLKTVYILLVFICLEEMISTPLEKTAPRHPFSIQVLMKISKMWHSVIPNHSWEVNTIEIVNFNVNQMSAQDMNLLVYVYLIEINKFLSVQIGSWNQHHQKSLWF